MKPTESLTAESMDQTSELSYGPLTKLTWTE